MSLNRSHLLKTVACITLTFVWVGHAAATTITFKEKNATQIEFSDLGPPGVSVQDQNSGYGIIYDLKGNNIGAFDFFSTVTNITSDSAIKLLYVHYSFGDGTDSITAESRIENKLNSVDDTAKGKPANYAITGGTGKYAGARGACRVVQNGPSDWVETCKFQALNIKF